MSIIPLRSFTCQGVVVSDNETHFVEVPRVHLSLNGAPMAVLFVCRWSQSNTLLLVLLYLGYFTT